MRNQFHNEEDAILLERISRDDRKAFSCLFRKHWKELYHSAFYVTRNQALSMDVVQEVFVWLWENRKQWTITNVRLYLKSAVKYKVANAIRKEKLQTSMVEGWKERNKDRQTHVSSELELEELKKVILDFTGKLPPRCREIFRLSRFEHLTNKEIAERLDISEKTVENQITIALRRLRKHLGRLTFWLVFFL